MKKIIASAIIGLMLTSVSANAQDGYMMMDDMPPSMDGQMQMKRPEMPSPDEMFKKIDTDGNGSISLEEFKTNQAQMQKIREERMEKMKEMRGKMRGKKAGTFMNE